jgi:hypothetical protein
MLSSRNLIKSELYARLYDSIEKRFGGIELPKEFKTFIVWDNKTGTAQEQVEAREKELLQQFGTLEGFDPLIISWEGTEMPT